MSVGVMKDYKLKQRDLGVSHTLGLGYVYVYYESLKRELKTKTSTYFIFGPPRDFKI